MRTLIAAALTLFTAQAVPPAHIQRAGTRNAISGRVTTADGRPAAGAIVTLLEKTLRDGSLTVHIVDARLQIVTDADGRYMMPDARIGDFYVVAIPRNAALGPDGRLNRSGHATTFFPSTRSLDEATAVHVNVREGVTADITLVAAPLATVRGRVLTSKQSPAPGGTLHIARGNHLFGIASVRAPLRPDGTFALGGMAPGTYFLQYRESAWPPPRGETPLISDATVVLDGQDVVGVRVEPLHMVRANGRVIVPAALRAELPREGIVVGASPIDVGSDGNPGPTRPGALKDDLTFEFATWPGQGRVRVDDLPYAWRIKTVRYQGKDVTTTGIAFTGPQVVSGIEIELERGVR